MDVVLRHPLPPVLKSGLGMCSTMWTPLRAHVFNASELLVSHGPRARKFRLCDSVDLVQELVPGAVSAVHQRRPHCIPVQRGGELVERNTGL